MTDLRDVHAVPFEAGAIAHRADRRCSCGPVARQDLNVPSRVVYVHRSPPTDYEHRTLVTDPRRDRRHRGAIATVTPKVARGPDLAARTPTAGGSR